MKKLLFLAVLILTSVKSFSQVYVRSYVRSNGTVVQSHQRTYPNHTRNDNYSTIGNVNPYTGKEGTKPRDGYTTYSSSSYSTKSTYTPSSYSTYTPSSYSSNSTYTPSTYSSSSSYSTPVYTGSRGGNYYINSNGNKTYVPR